MTVQSHLDIQNASQENAAVEQVTQLYAVLALVEKMAGRQGQSGDIPDETALASAYDRASGVSRRRFQIAARSAANAATVGVSALVERDGFIGPAALQLANHMRQELERLADIAGLRR